MRVRKRKNLPKKNSVLVFLFLLPLIGVGAYASVLVIILEDIGSYNYQIGPPDTDHFIDKDDIDPDLMADLAGVLNNRLLEYHLPLNLSVTVTFSDYSYETVADIHETDNAALYGGETMAAQCFRYATAKKENNKTEMAHSIQIIKRLVSGYSLLLAVPNGGIGPEYPGLPARFYSPPGKEYQEEYPEIFSDHYKMFNGTGDYKNWRCRLKTSLDEMGGYAVALGMVLKFVDPDDSEVAEWCYERVRVLVAQLVEGFKKTNWLVLYGDGTPAGSDLNMDIGGGAWKLAFLKLGAIAYPEKYAQEYAYTYSKALHSSQVSEGSIWNTIEEYYAFAFSQCLVLSLILNEDNEKIRDHYIKTYSEGFYGLLKYHRNAFVNSAFLAFMSLMDKDKRERYEDPEYEFDKVEWDINDQLFRFMDWGNPRGMNLAKEQWGIRNYNLTQRPHSTRSTSLNPDIREKERNPRVKFWREWIDNNIFGSLYAWVKDDLYEMEDMYIVPKTVSESSAGALIWGSNPFQGEGGDPYENGLQEERGNGFLLPYYLGRYYGFVEGPSN